jgi:hypothetical protein
VEDWIFLLISDTLMFGSRSSKERLRGILATRNFFHKKCIKKIKHGRKKNNHAVYKQLPWKKVPSSKTASDFLKTFLKKTDHLPITKLIKKNPLRLSHCFSSVPSLEKNTKKNT